MATEQEILNHQLKGVMLHSDMVDVYHLLRMWRMCKVHKRQMYCEQGANIKTRFKFIDKKGAITEPGPVARIKLPDLPADTFLTSAQRDEIHMKLLQEWHKWETATADMYAEQIALDPDCRLWHCLKHDAECEIARIEKWMG